MNEGFDTLYPEMSKEIAEENNVVAAGRCAMCKFFNALGGNRNYHDDGGCDKLHCHTWANDICKHYDQL